MASSVDEVLDLVLRARRRLAAAALAEALCGPVAAFLLAAAAVVGAARWGGRADLPGGFLLAAGIAAALAVGARLVRGLPDEADAALHLDRALGARERFSTVLETAGAEPALAAFAARGALERASAGPLAEALALRPPAALLPLLLAGIFAAGVLLLPMPAVGVPMPLAGEGGVDPASSGGTAAAAAPAAVPDTAKATAGRGSAAAAAAAPAAATASAAEALAILEDRARRAGDLGALRALGEARAALAAGDEATAAAALRRAAASLGVPEGAVVPGVTGGGAAAGAAAAASEGARPPAAEAFSPAAVPLRARAAAERYFGRRP